MLDKLFHSKNRAGILALFLNNEDKKFYIQEVIKLTKGDPANTHRELINLQSLSILESENKGKQKIISAEVPLGEMFGYATTVRSLSSGRANASMEFSKYLQAPQEIVQKILEEKAKKTKNEG